MVFQLFKNEKMRGEKNVFFFPSKSQLMKEIEIAGTEQEI